MSEKSLEGLKEKYDLAVLTAGFEERTISGLEQIADKITIGNSIINFYQPEEVDLNLKNAENLKRMKLLLSKCVKEENFIIENRPDEPNRFYEVVKTYIKGTNQILVDITSFTRLFLYSLLHSCLVEGVKVDVLYSEPKTYTMNFSQGLEKIMILHSYPGLPDQSKKVLMIMFLGWESRRAESVIEEFDPDLLITFYETSEDPIRKHWNDVTMTQCKKLLENSESFGVPALKPDLTVEKFEELYKTYHETYDICLLNIGPKSQCLAVAEFAKRHDDVQVLYPKPYKWTQELPDTENAAPISTGSGRTYLFQFPLK